MIMEWVHCTLMICAVNVNEMSPVFAIFRVKYLKHYFFEYCEISLTALLVAPHLSSSLLTVCMSRSMLSSLLLRRCSRVSPSTVYSAV